MEQENTARKNQISAVEIHNNTLQRELEELKPFALDIKVSAVRIGNINNSNEVLDNYGATLYANGIRYLSTRIICDSRIMGNKTFYIKIINPSGILRWGNNSPKGYSYSWDVYISKGINSLDLGGFGADSRGYYTPGTYTVEVWDNNICIGFTPVTLY